MAVLPKRFLCIAIVVIGVLILRGSNATAAGQVATKVLIYDASGNVVTSPFVAEKGVGKHFTARVFDQDGRPMHADVQWFSDADTGIAVKDTAGATVTMTKDLYDDPNGFEPWTNIRACVGELCAWVCVNGAVNLSGSWRVYVEVTNAPFGSQWVNLRFAQDGRNLSCSGITDKPITATLNGRTLLFHDPNNELTYFRGSLTVSGRARGQWVSYKGYKGNWYARR